MLQTKAVKQHTFALLKELMSVPILNDFSLAGGTGLALQIGHRFSEDIDLFLEKKYDENQALQALRKIFNKILLSCFEKFDLFSRCRNRTGS